MSEHREIAKIEGVFLGFEDHGIFTCYIHFDYGKGGAQSGGGYAFSQYDRETERRVGSRFGCEFVMRLLNACGVDEWSKLKGRTVFAIRDREGFQGRVIGIEPLPTEPGERFIFKELADELREPEGVAA